VELSEREPLLARAPQQASRLELRDLEHAIAKLPRTQRSVILIVGLEGMSYGEVAAVLEVPVGTIRSRLSRGREALRRLTGVVRAEEPDIVMTRPTVGNRPMRPPDGPAGRSEISVDRGALLSPRRAGSRKRSLPFSYPAERNGNGHRAA
jgi:hypothetical protein